MGRKAKRFLFDYLDNASPTGFEHKGQQLWVDYTKSYVHEHIVDNYGTVVGVINPKKPYKVVIEAHADEISWFVNYITDDGYIYVCRNGGSDHQIAPSMRVNIHTEKGSVKGIFGWPAIHIRDRSKERVPSLKNLFIDVGCESKKEVESLGVHVGCPITFDDRLIEMNENYLVGRGLDNRMGGYMIAEVARMLSVNKKRLPFCLYIVNSVQEEIGLRGAEMISRKLKPHLAICTDVTHDTCSPAYEKKEIGAQQCGKGPVLCYGPAVQNNLLKEIIKVAETKKIPFQRQAVSRSTGTDTDSFAYSAEGVPSALISLPLKYMHTTVETVHKNDVDNVIKLIYAVLLHLKVDTDYRYIK